jgi:hypothetical protein
VKSVKGDSRPPIPDIAYLDDLNLSKPVVTHIMQLLAIVTPLGRHDTACPRLLTFGVEVLPHFPLSRTAQGAYIIQSGTGPSPPA